MKRSRARRTVGYAGISALILAFGAAGAAPAFVLNQLRGTTSSKWFPSRWPALTRQIPFMLNDKPLEMLPNLAQGSEPALAVEAAMQAWSFAPVRMSLEGQVSETDVGQDGINLITLANTPGNRDVVKNFLALTLRWYGSRAARQTYFPITETDIVVNSQDRWATDRSADRYDLQTTLTHELGHTLGLSHSAVMAATMFPYSGKGRGPWRVPDADDRAGVQALYEVPSDAETGQISGQVINSNGKPVFGAHVVAAAADGGVPTAVLTEPDGSFTLPFLPAGGYQVYAEPLQGTTTLVSFPSRYETAATNFRTAFAGSDRAPTTVAVVAGETTALDPIRVSVQSPTLSPGFLAWSSDGRQFSSFDLPLVVKPGDDGWLVLVGQGMDTVTELRITGQDISVDMSQSTTGTTTRGYSYLIVPVSVQPGARPGARNLILDTGGEVAAFTGGIRVMVP